MGYFEEAVTFQPNAPIMPPVAPILVETTSPSTSPSTHSESSEFRGLPVRASGDRVFILLKGKKYWVSSPEALAKAGFKLGDEVKIDQETLDILPEGEPIK